MSEQALSLPLVGDLLQELGRKEGDPDTAEIQQRLDTAIEVAEAHVGKLTPDVYRFHNAGGPLLFPATHLGRILSATDPSGTEVEFAPGSVDLLAGVVDGNRMAGMWEIHTEPQPVTESIRSAIIIIAVHLWNLRRGGSGKGRSFAQDEIVQTPAGFAVPRRAAELMNARIIPGVA